MDTTCCKMVFLKFVFLFFLFLSCALSNPVNSLNGKQPFSIEEAVLGKLSVATFSGKWISDVEIEYLDKSSKDVKVYNVAQNTTVVALKASVLEKYKTTKYSFSPDRQFVLISYDEKSIFRHSKSSRYVIYSVKNGQYYDVSKDHLQLAEWGPKDNTIVYIKDNNIYVILKITDKVQATQITKDGKPGSVYNGVGDWVYEEEILSSGKAFWFSPNGDHLAFITFFDSKVKNTVIPEYGIPRDPKYQYPIQVDVPYPKAGSPNPTYELRHVSLDNLKALNVIANYSSGKEVLYDLQWVNNELVVILQTNRVQNESRTSMCEVKSDGYCCPMFEERNPKGWANTNMLIINEKASKILKIEGVPVGQFGKFKHLVFYSQSETPYPLTGGTFEVLKIIHWDKNRKLIYYSATEENSATATQVYVVSEEKGSKPTCLTCRIKSPEGRFCTEASAAFSKNSSYVIVNCNGPDPRVVYLYKNEKPFGNPLAILEDNSKLRTALKNKLLPDILNLTVEVPGPFKADVRLMLPPNLDRSGKTKYPLLIYVYGGPASKNINDAFKLDWGLYLSTNLSVIYGFIDGRNTLRKGENMLFAGFRALGTLEMEDQINVTRSLQKTFPFIDSSRTAIWGWSYGGYATTKILELDTQNIFKCGIAVAPVADWMYYDSMYTERYMGLPQENKKGYESSSVLVDVLNLRKKQYLLIHGNADDNVHYQNAMMIAKLLEQNNIPFDLMSYPDEDHSILNVRPHLYYTMSRFWKKCFNLPA